MKNKVKCVLLYVNDNKKAKITLFFIFYYILVFSSYCNAMQKKTKVIIMNYFIHYFLQPVFLFLS
jgi:hypothetical protein